MRVIASFVLGTRTIEVAVGDDAVWAIIRRGEAGGLALRAAHAWGSAFKVDRAKCEGDEALRIEVACTIGVQTVELRLDDSTHPVLRVTTSLTPAQPVVLPALPRDLYVLGEGDDPLTAEGHVEAAQRGLNAGLCYFQHAPPEMGAGLYFQNLTALNDYFRLTGTKPDGAIGGAWPELGYLAPTPPQGTSPADTALPAGETVTLSDVILAFHDDAANDEQESARHFLQMLGAAFRQLDAPATTYRDWVGRADRTLHDLSNAPEATIRHYGHTYIHPYTADEYPDVMVQMATIAALRDYAAWTDSAIPFCTELEAGLSKFYDRDLRTMRRYLPNVGKDKDKLAVDSWYLYHPLLNLGRLARAGDARAKRFFTRSLDYAVKAARHFHYAWPIQFKVDSFEVIVAARNEDGLGQTDVGGLYAFVMVQAFELTGEHRYLIEARKAIDAAKEMRFELNYQANLTAWGAAACMRLWRITDEVQYLRQGYVYLASFFHNCAIWESDIANAADYKVFLGATCLHDAPYMAIFECFDSFTAFELYLKDSGPDLDPAVRLLISEYCRYALDRAWYYYPDALKPEAIAQDDIRNGHIDRALSFPLEDLYVDGQPAGQVGQEIYGAGAAFVFATRAFHTVEDAPFRIFCDHFPVTNERTSERTLLFGLDGGQAREASFSLVRLPHRKFPAIELRTADGETIEPVLRGADRIDYRITASGQVSLHW